MIDTSFFAIDEHQTSPKALYSNVLAEYLIENPPIPSEYNCFIIGLNDEFVIKSFEVLTGHSSAESILSDHIEQDSTQFVLYFVSDLVAQSQYKIPEHIVDFALEFDSACRQFDVQLQQAVVSHTEWAIDKNVGLHYEIQTPQTMLADALESILGINN